jgi:hypothetical protein
MTWTRFITPGATMTTVTNGVQSDTCDDHQASDTCNDRSDRSAVRYLQQAIRQATGLAPVAIVLNDEVWLSLCRDLINVEGAYFDEGTLLFDGVLVIRERSFTKSGR